MADKSMKIVCVVGARPNFMKMAPIIKQMRSKASKIEAFLLHTGQHYDADMKEQFFNQLGIPEPDVDLEVGSASHAVQTAEVMKRFEPVLDRINPDAVLVVGDVNSTIACALVAKKKGINVIHVESGLRSYDRGMPEEINRVLTDQISDYLFITEKSAEDNLVKEGVDPSRIFFVGNVMIDTLFANLKKATDVAKTFATYELDGTFTSGLYSLVTLHRPSNVDDRETLRRLLETIGDISTKAPVVFPIHPRTRLKIEEFGYSHLLEKPSIAILPPLGYLDLLGLCLMPR